MNPFSTAATRAREIAKTLQGRGVVLGIAGALAVSLTAHATEQDRPPPLQALEKMVSKPMTDSVWGRLQSSRWVADGSDKAPKTVYVFTDLNCPYCNKFWSDARPWVDTGRVQLRHVIVGILTPTSPGKAAALLTEKDAAAVLASYERGQVAGTKKAMTSGRPHPLSDDGMKPLASVPPAIQRQLDANEKVMTDLGLRATPAIVWRNDMGTVQMRTGIPDEALAAIFGPR